MTLEQTRQLGIEFERRVQTMIPETEFAAKLDTETIYSYLNQYQDKLIHDLYRTIDQVPVSNNQTYIETLLHTMMSSFDAQLNLNDMSVLMPENFGLYVTSYSDVTRSYGYKSEGNSGKLPNKLIAQKDIPTILNKPYDNMRILRAPMIWIGSDRKLHLIYDKYTKPKSVHVNYYRVPNYMDLMTSSPCELPMEMFEPLVSGAVDLYVQYVAGAESRKRQMAEEARKQQRNNRDDERD